jgi:uncharacterized LabA/DUF88 family protein
MKREQSGTFLSAVFVDYDNIYLSLKRKSEDAAKRFAKDAQLWIKAIETGQIITSSNNHGMGDVRRIVMNRCYGNPVPRRSQSDNSTDMNSFPFVRHHFLRAGFEIVDCPPLTAQLKNSSDIRMVMDVRDYLTHPTYFDEFVILSGDADFTPVLHRLRAHARRTVIFANDYTAAPYTAISDGEVREADLIALLLDSAPSQSLPRSSISVPNIATNEPLSADAARHDILADVAAAVRSSPSPVPLEVLADRAVRVIGHDKTIGTAWGGAGGFRELLSQGLPEDLKLSGEPPYVVIDTRRHDLREPVLAARETSMLQTRPVAAQSDLVETRQDRLIPSPNLGSAPQRPERRDIFPARHAASPLAAAPRHAPPPARTEPSFTPAPVPAAARPAAGPSTIQQSIARIHEACQAPPLAPPEYRLLFETMAQEINENGLVGAQTISNIAQRALERGVEIRRDDVWFVLEVVSEADPWFAQGASANLFAGRFRNFVVARCRSQGLNLSADELDLVEAWFAGNAAPSPAAATAPRSSLAAAAPVAPAAPKPPAPMARETVDESSDHRSAFWAPTEDMRPLGLNSRVSRPELDASEPEMTAEEFPRIIRTRLRG